jgi:hypothetical protein
MADLGFENFKYRNATAFWDAQAGASDLYFLNENYLYFAVVPGYDFKFIDFEYPTNADRMTAHVRWYGNLVVVSRRSQGWMSAITSVT